MNSDRQTKIKTCFNADYFRRQEERVFGYSRGSKIFLLVTGNKLDAIEVKRQREKLKNLYGYPATQQWVAGKLGVDPIHYRKIECGQVGTSLRILKEMCRLFVCDANILLGVKAQRERMD